MKWRRWIKKQGVKEVAYRLHIHHNTVRNWLVDGGTPKDSLKKALVKLAKGEIEYADFFK